MPSATLRDSCSQWSPPLLMAPCASWPEGTLWPRAPAESTHTGTQVRQDGWTVSQPVRDGNWGTETPVCSGLGGTFRGLFCTDPRGAGGIEYHVPPEVTCLSTAPPPTASFSFPGSLPPPSFLRSGITSQITHSHWVPCQGLLWGDQNDRRHVNIFSPASFSGFHATRRVPTGHPPRRHPHPLHRHRTPPALAGSANSVGTLVQDVTSPNIRG